MKKRKQKVLSLLLSVMLLLGMITAVTVSAEDTGMVTTTIYENHFNDASDLNRIKSGYGVSSLVREFDADGGYGTGAAKFTLNGISATQNPRLWKLSDVTFKKGATYHISLWMKTDKSVSESDAGYMNVEFYNGPVKLSDGKAYARSRKYFGQLTKDAWKQFTLDFTIDDFVVSTSDLTSVGKTSDVADFNFEFYKAYSFVDGDVLWIDDVVITETMPAQAHDVTVNISGNGTVKNGAETVNNGDVITVDNDGDLTLTVTPDSGYVAEVSVDGQAATLSSNQLTLANITTDKTVSVNFAEKTATTVIYENHFDNADDLKRISGGYGVSSLVREFDADGGYGTGAAKFTLNGISATQNPRLWKLSDLTFKKGATYHISFWVKADKNVSQSDAGYFNAEFYNGPVKLSDGKGYDRVKTYYGKLTQDAWKKLSVDFTIDDFVVSTSNLTSTGKTSDVADFNFEFYKAYSFVDGDVLWIDDIVITETMPTVAEVSNTGAYEVQKTNLSGDTYVKAAGDTFDYYAMRFLFALTVKENAECSDVNNYGAYLIPWDVLNGGELASSSARRVFYNAAEYPVTKAQNNFAADLMGIPKAAAGRTMYVVPFVNGTANLDEAYRETIAE